MPITIDENWKPVVDSVLADPGLVVVMGGTDVGKTSFTLHLANASIAAGKQTAVIDGDIGQSEIGIPGVIASGIVDHQIEFLREIKSHAAYFVGSITPANNMLLMVAGMRLVADRMHKLSPELMIVDTCGYISGAGARRLNTGILEVLDPSHIVAMQRSDELDHFLRFMEIKSNTTIHRVPASKHAHAKPLIIRRQRRYVHFSEYFLNGKIHQIPLDDVVFSGTWLRSGKPLDQRMIKYLETTLKTNVFYAEHSANGVYIVASGEGDQKGREELEQYFKTGSIMVVPASRYINLLVGLIDEKHDLVGCGIIHRIDYMTRIISVYSPIKTALSVKAIKFGSLKLRQDGVEIGIINPRSI